VSSLLPLLLAPLLAGEATVPMSVHLDRAGVHPCGIAEWFEREAEVGEPIEIQFALAPIETQKDAVEPAEKIFARVLTRHYRAYYGEDGREPDPSAQRISFTAHTADLKAILPAVRADQVQMTWTGPIPFAQLYNEVGATPLLTATRFGSMHYFSGLIVAKARAEEAGIRTLCDLKGKKVAWVSPTSGSGYVIPRMMLSATTCDGERIDPETFFSEAILAGSQAGVVKAVAMGQVDVGATWTDPPAKGTGAWNKYFGGIYASQIEAIWHSAPIPNDSIGVSQRFRTKHPRVALQTACVLSLLHEDPEGLAFMKSSYGIDRLVPAQIALYETVAEGWCREHGGKRCAALARKLHGAKGAAAASRRTQHTQSTWQNPMRMQGAMWVLIICFAFVLILGRKAGPTRSWGFTTLIIGVVAWAAYWTDFTPGAIFHGLINDISGSPDGSPNGRGDFFDQLALMAELDLTVAMPVIESTVETLQSAVVATFVALLVSLTLGFMAAENVNRKGWLRGGLRFLLNADRSIDTLIVAIILVGAYGLGPLPGTLALAIHSVGMLAKLFYEAIESIDGGPVEALESAGSSHLGVIRWAMVPQVVPFFISYTLYRLELNVRGAVVLGLVGGGGIGRLLMEYSAVADWGKVATVILVIMALVMVLDGVSAKLRRDLTT
jgi:phosphonate transport system permease protein